MATKSDIARMTTTLDEVVGLMRKKDQELVFMSERVSRVEEKANRLDGDIKKIKPLVGLTYKQTKYPPIRIGGYFLSTSS